jgi:hypothetical protein
MQVLFSIIFPQAQKTRLSGFLKFTTNHNHNIAYTLISSHLVEWQLAAIIILLGA